MHGSIDFSSFLPLSSIVHEVRHDIQAPRHQLGDVHFVVGPWRLVQGRSWSLFKLSSNPHGRLKTPTARAATSLKRKRTPIKPEPSLFDPATFSTMFQRELKLLYNGSYTSRGLVFHHGLLELKLDLHSISLNSANIPSRILGLFKRSSHPALVDPAFLPLKNGLLKKASGFFLSPQRRRRQ